MKKRFHIIPLLLLTLATNSFAAKTLLTGVHVVKGEAYTSLVFDVSAPQGYKIFTLQHPDRLVVDIADGHLRTDTKGLDFKNTHFTAVRHGRFDAHTFRVVFDMDGTLIRYNSTMRAVNPSKAQLVVDIYPASATKKLPETKTQTITTTKTISKSVASAVSNNAAAVLGNTSKTFKTPKIRITEALKPRQIIVVIDAGHGGKDPGTIGRNGTQEKDVVLSISLRLAELINRDPTMHAVLTRTGDYFVPLRDRLRLARKDKADLFVAIHADSYFNNHLTGASVYALSQHGATTEAARWIARRENYSELGGVSLGDLGDQSYVLRSVLIDLAQTATISDSIKLGTGVLSALQNVTTLHYMRVEQAPFMVLKSPDIPSILIETGFLSNPREEDRLRQSGYRDKLAQAILNGLHRYIITHPMTASAASITPDKA